MLDYDEDDDDVVDVAAADVCAAYEPQCLRRYWCARVVCQIYAVTGI